MAINTDNYNLQPTQVTEIERLVGDMLSGRAGSSYVLYGSKTWDAASTADGAQATTTVTVTGAELGDYVEVSMGVSLVLATLTGYVSAADTVTVVLQNESGATLDLASTTLRARVTKKF